MTLTVSFFYLRSKSLFLWITWFHFFLNVDDLGVPKIWIMNIYDINSFLKMLHFYPTLKNGRSKHDFFVLLNAPVGVHERPKNLLRRIGIRDLTFCDTFFRNFFIKTFMKSPFLKTKTYRQCNHLFTNNNAGIVKQQ